MLAIATRPGSNSLLGLIALVPLFYTIHTVSPVTAVVRGGVWGAAVAVVLALDLGEPVHPWAALIILPFLTGAYTAGGAALTRWIGFSPFVLGVGWAIVELVISGLGQPLGLLGSTLYDTWLMQQIGAVLGYVIVAFLVAYLGALVVSGIARVIYGNLVRTCTCDARLMKPCQFEAAFVWLWATESGCTRSPPLAWEVSSSVLNVECCSDF